MFLTGKTSVIPLNWAPSEIGDKEIIIEEIAAVTGVPVSLLKANDPNLASAQVGFASWRDQTTLPLCRHDEEFLNHELLPHFGIEEDAFIAYDDPVPENRDELRQDGDVAIRNGCITRNEWRMENGYEVFEDENADSLLLPTGYQPIDKVGEMPPMGAFSFGSSGDSKPPRKEPDGDEDDEDDGADEKTIKQSATVYTKGHADDTERDGESEKLIRNMTLELSRLFTMQRRACLRVLAGDKALKASAGLLSKLVAEIMSFVPQFSEALAPFMERVLSQGGKVGLQQINVPDEAFSVVNPAVSEFMRNYSVRLAGEICHYTAEMLSETLAEGFDNGENTSSLSRRVGEIYNDFSGYRSEMIARTESARAFVAGTEEAWSQSEVVEGKTWQLAAGGCDVCEAIAREYADKAIPLGQAFYPLGSNIPLPGGRVFKVDYTAIMGPPGHPHCRCGVLPVLKRGDA